MTVAVELPACRFDREAARPPGLRLSLDQDGTTIVAAIAGEAICISSDDLLAAADLFKTAVDASRRMR